MVRSSSVEVVEDLRRLKKSELWRTPAFCEGAGGWDRRRGEAW